MIMLMVCVCVCMRASVRACVRACVDVCKYCCKTLWKWFFSVVVCIGTVYASVFPLVFRKTVCEFHFCADLPPSTFGLRKHPCAPGAVNRHYFVWIFFYGPYRNFHSFIYLHSVRLLKTMNLRRPASVHLTGVHFTSTWPLTCDHLLTVTTVCSWNYSIAVRVRCTLVS